MPLKSLVLFSITVGAVLLGMAGPALMRMSKIGLFTESNVHSWVYTLGSFFIPLLLVFFGLSLFYRLAPRRPTQFIEVWIAALCSTALLQVAESPFVIYLKNFATLNVIFGAIGGIMALLLWIYVSGYIFIFGACLCAAQAEMRSVR
jgi:YihY family inner membrane protein